MIVLFRSNHGDRKEAWSEKVIVFQEIMRIWLTTEGSLWSNMVSVFPYES